ncbi:Low-density lipoprotein receptor-related protein 6 [Holothuria leucospilota]|uniref:Low-density lipoprotein receptor-related protein 6 n=1 Tax=Holothuria leucospilota TaxID=206669 RepID=A0A9Q1HBE2_HOLLE|nr:Low-density lipoprotein receptor-related protein 6 [Holothuria leucospilota]
MDSRIAFLFLTLTLILQTGLLVEGQACVDTLTDSDGILDYPTTTLYENDLDCTWTFMAPAGMVVEVTFTTVDLEDDLMGTCFDTITVYDGPTESIPLTLPFCGEGPYWPQWPARFVSTSNLLSISMKTDSSVGGTGFRLEYKHVPPRIESIAAVNVDSPSIIQFNRFAFSLLDHIPLSQSTRPSALDFDPITEFFYYTDIGTGFIGRIKYDASSEEVLIQENVQTPLGVAVAYLTGLLYWTDFDRDEVSVSRLDGSFPKILVFPNSGCNSPRAITLSADQQDMFWTCAGKIMKAKADGTNSMALVEGLHDARAIVLDEDMYLYWVDVATSTVDRILTDGNGYEELFVHDSFSGVHSFALDSFSYFWSRDADKELIFVSRLNPTHIRTIAQVEASTMEGLYYYKSDQPIAQQHVCATGAAGCDELCFPQGASYICAEASTNLTTVSTEATTATPATVSTRGCVETISNSNGNLDYPSTAVEYENNLDCVFSFVAPAGLVVEITFTGIDLESDVGGICFDAITVFDGTPESTALSLPFCGDGPFWPPWPIRFLSTSNRLSVTMTTDTAITGTGFQLEYKHVPPRIESVAAVNVDSPSIIQFNRLALYLLDPIPLSQSTRPSALDFDPITEFFYYTDIGVGFIGRIKYNASLEEVLVQENVQTPLGVAVAYLTGLLYWTDFDRDEVSVSRLDGSFRRILIFPNSGCNSPRAITLSADQQEIFWTCMDKIMKANADGTSNETLVEGLHDARAIALDEDMYLYWVDVATSTVDRIKTDGSGYEELFLHGTFSGVHSFVLDSHNYFWSRDADKELIFINRQNPTQIRTISQTEASTMEGLYYYKSDKPIAQQHICATNAAGCEELCFPQGIPFICSEATTTTAPMILSTRDNISTSTAFSSSATPTTPTTVSSRTCVDTLSDSNGILDYPTTLHYENNLNCTWNFIAPSGLVVEITFNAIDLEPEVNGVCFDTITVYDGSPGSKELSLPFCGDGPFWPRSPIRFLSSSNRLSVTMETDHSETGTGFQLAYKHVPSRIESVAAVNVDSPSIIQFDRFAPYLFERILLSRSTRPSALDFDPITQFFYYTDIDIGFIGRIKYDASLEEVLVQENVQTPLGVAVAYLTGLLYWTDFDRDEVSVSRLDGSFPKILVFPNSGCNSPRAITLSADQQDIFWTCIGKIVKAKADGANRVTLVEGLHDGRAIVLDEDMYLYWVDVATSTVDRIKTDGSGYEELFEHELFSGVHSFVLDSFTYFWSRDADKELIFVNRQNPTHINTIAEVEASTMEGLYYYKSDKTIAQQHVCARDAAGCEELCFPRGASFMCVEATVTTPTTIPARVCNYTLTDRNGIVDYPGNAVNYTNNLNCTWNFIAPEGRVVEITFTTIDLEPRTSDVCFDMITVYDGVPGSRRFTSPFCGEGPYWPRWPVRFLSTSNRLSVTMETDSSKTGTGYQLQYKHELFRRESVAAIAVDTRSIVQFNRFSLLPFDRIPLVKSARPSALDFDPITEFFYYTDLDIGFIGRIKYDASSEEVLAEENINTPLGVAVAYLTGLLYWTDIGRDEVSVSRLDGSFRKTLVYPNGECNSPRAITLSADQQTIFWTCDGKIIKARADGSERETLVESLHEPRAIALDEDDYLYWVDVVTSSVDRIKADGSGYEELFVHDAFSRVHSFVLDSFAYFWSRDADKEIIYVDRHSPRRIGIITEAEPSTMEGVYYYKSDQPIAQQHACATGRSGCDELCLPQGASHTCVEVSPVVIDCPNDVIKTTSRSYERVSWNEPVARSRTSQQNGKILMHDTRSHTPGGLFGLGSTNVTYTFKDELSNNATCSFTVIIQSAASSTGIATTVATTSSFTPDTVLQTAKAMMNFGSSRSISNYIIYIIIGSIVLALVLIILITVGIMCLCGLECNCRPKSRRPRTDQPFGMTYMGHPNDGTTTMASFPQDINQEYLQLK